MSDGRPLRVPWAINSSTICLGFQKGFKVKFIPAHPGFNSFVHATNLSRTASGPWSAAVKRLLLASPSQCLHRCTGRSMVPKVGR